MSARSGHQSGSIAEKLDGRSAECCCLARPVRCSQTAQALLLLVHCLLELADSWLTAW